MGNKLCTKRNFFLKIQRKKPTATNCNHLSIPIVNFRSLNTLSQFKEGRDSGLRAMKTRISENNSHKIDEIKKRQLFKEIRNFPKASQNGFVQICTLIKSHKRE